MDLPIERFRSYRGYENRDTPPEDAELTHVGPGTPCGEYLRRFWHGIALSREVGDLPLAVRLFGEDLVLFRDGGGRIGLLHRHCAHRGASLEFGRIEDRGIRCCYHGWRWDVDGTLLEAPAEPANSPLFARVRQGGYPAFEYKGIVFAYLGPPEETPEFPVYDTFEIPDTVMEPYTCSFPCNWLQVTENGIDPVHSMFLHTLVNGPQFADTWGVLGDVEYHEGAFAVYCTIARRVDAHIWTRVQENILPNVTQSGAVHSIDGHSRRYFGRNTFFRWCVPVDDTHTKVVAWANFGERTDPTQWNTPDNIEILEQGEIFERPAEERQRRPGDYEAMVGQGAIVVHAKENRGTSDKGVSLFRRRVRQDIRALAAGRRPAQPASFGPAPIPTWSGDNVLRIPACEGGDDRALRAATMEKVVAIYCGAEGLRGDERDALIAAELQKLESADSTEQVEERE
jgi:nitrite reductase/ring-hydroxylating ferredoxin subunit